MRASASRLDLASATVHGIAGFSEKGASCSKCAESTYLVNAFLRDLEGVPKQWAVVLREEQLGVIEHDLEQRGTAVGTARESRQHLSPDLLRIRVPYMLMFRAGFSHSAPRSF